MTRPTSEPEHIPATTGVQPDAPNATHRHDDGLADGPPAVDDEVDVEPTDDR